MKPRASFESFIRRIVMSTQGYDTFVKPEELGRYAQDSAKTLVTGNPVSTLYTALNAEKMLTLIKAVMHSATSFAEAHVTIPQEIEWLLDNWYIAEREGKCAISDIKTAPRLKCALNKKKRLVVSEAALALVQSGGGTVTSERVEIFLDAFQDSICLTESELAFFIPALRLELIARLAEACQKLRFVITDGVVEDGLAAYFGRLFSSLRFLSGFDASKILESVNRVELTLRQDHAGIYPEMDEQTRFSYRREIARLAEDMGDSEHQAASRILTLSQKNDRHVGYYIFAEPLGSAKKRRTGALYISTILLLSLFIALLISFMLNMPAISLLLLLPVSEFVKNVTDYIVLRLLHPQRIQRLELQNGVPDEGRTLCVVSILISSADSGPRAAGLLEEYRLANRDAGSNLLFGILADLPDSKTGTSPDDEKFIGSAKAEIDRLNNEYAGVFFFFAGGAVINDRDKRFTAWERKEVRYWSSAAF
jgi:cyclic beta-1,2-glucan synthetase